MNLNFIFDTRATNTVITSSYLYSLFNLFISFIFKTHPFLPFLFLRPQNLIAQAQSGTGKTAAFTLGMLSRVDTSLNAPQAICASPVREISRQIAENVKLMGKFLEGLVVSVAIPMDKDDSREKPNYNGHVIVGTPGTLTVLIQKRVINVKNVKVLVLDEADNMLEQGTLREQSTKLQKALPRTVQTLCFSATYDPSIFKFAEKIVSDGGKRQYSKITLKVSELSLETVRQFYIDVGAESNKFEVLKTIFSFIQVGGQTIIFISRKDKAEEVQTKLLREKHTVSLLTSNMSGADRDQVLDNYRAGKSKILLSTNALARGIDILQIALVINYDLPTKFVNGRSTGDIDPETYLHRCGRSARYGRPGVVINFVHDDQSKRQILALQSLLKKEIEPMKEEDIPDLEEVMKKLRK
eukprot:TRINITY_DN2027_c0_g1_i2.p1 TRINITY_DN2027_c0_g1~~TRINITY_DN2027_c0_g1_i2.p1  ORF type:complete len:411 (+),score=89.16 TRINITY_DN2027_c0_g1_i2:96-1328(+)